MIPSAELIELARLLQDFEYTDNPPWIEYISTCCTKMKEVPPSLEMDILKCSIPQEEIIRVFYHGFSKKRNIRVFYSGIFKKEIDLYHLTEEVLDTING